MMKTFEEQYGVRILQAWGMTETSPLATVARPLPGVPDDQQWGLRSTQGRLVCGVEARIVDDDGNPLPHDGKAVGEVEVRGPWITGSYYLNRDESKFDDGWLHTGDVGRIDPFGYVTLTDRAKDVIKSGGEWISSVELENHLMGHPAVSRGRGGRGARRALAGTAAGGRRSSTRAPRCARRSCGSSWATKSFAGGCPSGGRSSTRCR